MTRGWLVAGPLGIVCTLLLGCGSSPPAISASASSTLVPQVAAVRAAAEAHDPAGALAILSRLQLTVADLQRAGQLAAGRAAAILTSVADVEAQLGTVSTTTSVAPATTPAPPPAHHAGKGKGKPGND